MSRNIGALTIAASQASIIRPVYFVKLAFDSADVNFHSDLGDLSFGGDTYSGVGTIGSISQMTEDSDTGSSPATLGLRGLPTDLLSILFNEQYQGRACTIYLGYLDVNRVLIEDPTIVYRGLMDVPTIQQDSQLAISLNVGNRFAAWNVPLVRRYNNADQQARYPGDKGMEFVATAANLQIIWGTTLANSVSTNGSAVG